MAGSLNKVTLIGNLGKDPEIRSTQAGKEIASFSIATSESWTDKSTGEKKEKTEWHNIAVFNEGLVRVVKQYVKKGSKLYIEGQLQTRKWQDKDGQDRYTTEIVANEMQMLDSRGAGQVGSSAESGDFAQSAPRSASAKQQVAPGAAPVGDYGSFDDDIPF